MPTASAASARTMPTARSESLRPVDAARLARREHVRIVVRRDGAVEYDGTAPYAKKLATKNHGAALEHGAHKKARRGQKQADGLPSRRRHGAETNTHEAYAARQQKKAEAAAEALQEAAAAAAAAAKAAEAMANEEITAVDGDDEEEEAATKLEEKVNSILAMGQVPKRRAEMTVEHKRRVVEVIQIEEPTPRRRTATTASAKGVKRMADNTQQLKKEATRGQRMVTAVRRELLRGGQ